MLIQELFTEMLEEGLQVPLLTEDVRKLPPEIAREGEEEIAFAFCTELTIDTPTFLFTRDAIRAELSRRLKENNNAGS
ncbi:MAG: hypothetical protein ACREQ5_12630 [Candidatus Dormibacteria bacterium]